MSQLTAARIRECQSPVVLSRATRLLMVWGNRPAADLAHRRLREVQQQRLASRAMLSIALHRPGFQVELSTVATIADAEAYAVAVLGGPVKSARLRPFHPIPGNMPVVRAIGRIDASNLGVVQYYLAQ